MRVYTKVVSDIETGAILSSESYEYQGPVELAMGDAGMDALADIAGPGDAGADAGGGVAVDTGNDVVVEEGADEALDLGAEGADTEQPDGQEPGLDEPKAEAAPQGDKEVLPAALSKAIRELKSAHPEQAPALKTLSGAYYKAKAFEQVYPTPEEARTDKAALEAVGGPSGISAMQSEIDAMDDFDRLAQEGSPRVIDTMANQFPEGFKRMVPAAIDRLSKVDPEAYRETMRGPLLQVMEGDGIIGAIADVMNYLKAAKSEPDAANVHMRSAEYRLNQLTDWYNNLKKQETDFKGRYQDPKLKELETERTTLRQQQTEFQVSVVRQDLIGYVNETLKPAITQILNGKAVPQGGRARFEQNVKQEIVSRLRANPNYTRGLRALVNKGQRQQAVAFAKPFIDAARRAATQSVFTDLYGSAPATQQRKAAPSNGQSQPRTASNGDQRQAQAGDKPIPINRKPDGNDIDWDKDPTRVLFVGNKAYLKSGKYVSWK